MLICSTFRITGLLLTYRYPTLSGASGCYVYLQSNKIPLHLWVSYFKCSPFLYALATEFQSYTTLTGVQPQMQPMFVSSTYRITGVHYTYGSVILCAANAGYHYLENHRVQP